MVVGGANDPMFGIYYGVVSSWLESSAISNYLRFPLGIIALWEA